MQTNREKENGDLIRLLDLDEEFIIELVYATPDNFTGQPVYASSECYINRNTARLLIEAKNIFKRDGYRVKVWDAYRPISAQIKFWNLCPDTVFVGRPPDLSKISEFIPKHLNGLCVDITLVDMDGKELEMPSAFDDFSERAFLSAAEPESPGRKNGEYLKAVMESVGFRAYENEWWHFYDVITEPGPYLDIQI